MDYASRSAIRLGILAACAVSLMGCSSIRDAAGLGKQSPDEFAVVTKQPLIIPPEFNLRPPRDGAPPTNQVEPTDSAQSALYDDPATAAKRMAGGQYTDAYFDQMEVLLGMRAARMESTESKERASQQPVQPQRQAAPVSAPPTREAPSMSTGRAPSPTKVTLSAAEQEVAYNSRPRDDMTRQEANALYARNKIELQRKKAAGEIV